MKHIVGSEQMQLQEVIRRFLVWLGAMGLASSSLSTYGEVLRLFLVWVGDQQIARVEQLTPDLFFAYQEALSFRLTRMGRPITLATQCRHLVVLRTFGRYLVEQDFLVSNPTRRIKLPCVPKALPRVIPDVKEAILLMESRTGEGLLSYRDRAILELLYSAGLRRNELVNLNLGDLDLVGGYCYVREGKGRKDRVVPLGHKVITALTIYLDAVRPTLLGDREEATLFLNRFGKRFSGDGIHHLVRTAAVRAKLSSKITPHALRHAAATHMLQNGAPIRHLQEFLGHASIDTTQIYTRITIPELKAIHAKYHPREKDNE